jgi:putative glycosyltransferase (TIGR04372 family)
VCFYARDSTYLDTVHNYRSRDDWAYLDYRDADINTYTPAVEELTRRGYFAVRMGAVVKDALTVSHPMIIDYARTSRSEFMDVFLAAQCNFFIGSTGGINSIPTIFRQPVAYVNFIPLGSEHLLLLGPASLLIPKKLWLRRENRFLTFRGTVELGVSGLHKSDRYKQLDLEVMDNSPEEIAAIAMEMDERLKGTWVTTDEDEILQERFRKLFGRQSDDAPPWRIGAAFLRQNQNLLDQ